MYLVKATGRPAPVQPSGLFLAPALAGHGSGIQTNVHTFCDSGFFAIRDCFSWKGSPLGSPGGLHSPPATVDARVGFCTRRSGENDAGNLGEVGREPARSRPARRLCTTGTHRAPARYVILMKPDDSPGGEGILAPRESPAWRGRDFGARPGLSRIQEAASPTC